MNDPDDYLSLKLLSEASHVAIVQGSVVMQLKGHEYEIRKSSYDGGGLHVEVAYDQKFVRRLAVNDLGLNVYNHFYAEARKRQAEFNKAEKLMASLATDVLLKSILTPE